MHTSGSSTTSWRIAGPDSPRPGRIEYRLDGLPTGAFTLFFEVEGLSLPAADTTPALLSALVPAMRRGANLEADGTVDPLLLRQLPGIQRILVAWMPDLHPIEIRAKAGPLQSLPPSTGVFFSGGTDSWFSLLKYAGIATHALHVWGFDVKWTDTDLADRILSNLKPTVERKGVQWVRIRTNLRDMTDPHAKWGEQQHGCAMGAIASLLRPAFGRIIIAGSYSYQLPDPFASHPMLDPLWSTSGCSVIHDGVEASRPDKLRNIMADPEALSTLRVCYENRNGAYNCGRCLKCTMTMLSMLILSHDTRYPGFQETLTPRLLAESRIDARFFAWSLRSRLDYIKPLLAERPDLAPYAWVLRKRLLAARTLMLLHDAGLRPIAKMLSKPLGFSRGFAKK